MHPGDQVGRRPWHRCVEADAAGVGARVAVANALEVPGGEQRNRSSAVAHGEQADFRAGQELFDQDGMARGQDSLGVGDCLRGVVGHDDPPCLRQGRFP